MAPDDKPKRSPPVLPPLPVVKFPVMLSPRMPVIVVTALFGYW